jgi:uncharacterized protein (TIGR03000 family)
MSRGFRGGYRTGLGGFGGYYSVYPYSSYYPYYDGFGGGFITGGYSPLYVVPGPDEYDLPPPMAAPAFPPEAPFVGLSGEFPAALSLQFPAAASVWLDGKEVGGTPATEVTLKSPILRPGQKHTFHIRARWETNGRTYETTKEVTLGPGDRSRLLVVSGTPVTDGK